MYAKSSGLISTFILLFENLESFVLTSFLHKLIIGPLKNDNLLSKSFSVITKCGLIVVNKTINLSFG